MYKFQRLVEIKWIEGIFNKNDSSADVLGPSMRQPFLKQTIPDSRHCENLGSHMYAVILVKTGDVYLRYHPCQPIHIADEQALPVKGDDVGVS